VSPHTLQAGYYFSNLLVLVAHGFKLFGCKKGTPMNEVMDEWMLAMMLNRWNSNIHTKAGNKEKIHFLVFV
jgi:hypothetical protein